MPEYLGIDTSNYTTSVAVYNNKDNTIIQLKKLLPVKSGELGIRQSDALFHHTKQLPELIGGLFLDKHSIKGIGVSNKPRNTDGSYMPCFLAGESLALCIGDINNINVHATSHQAGHILAALFSCNKLDLINEPFIAFHVSGGTTDCLLVEPDKQDIIRITNISSSLDLKAGQAVDRVGIMLGLQFPCGRALEELALKSTKSFSIKPSLKGLDCSLSGLENKCNDMLSLECEYEDIAKFCIDYICATVVEMTKKAMNKHGVLPLVYAGGVMSNSIIRGTITERFDAFFAKPEYSCDNAAGVAIYSALKEI